MKMQNIINIKKIVVDNENIQINYKGYTHGRRVWFCDKTFITWFKNVLHGYNLWQNNYKYYDSVWYKNKCIYDVYNKYISLVV